MKKYTELEQKIIDKQESKLKKFKISYYYLATGMEGIPDIFPEKVIEAPTKELATYIYNLMFFASTSLKEIENIKSYNGENYSFTDFESFLREDDVDKYWGTSIEELK
jgi:hypothetical protein